jgi:hypothetical protein
VLTVWGCALAVQRNVTRSFQTTATRYGKPEGTIEFPTMAVDRSSVIRKPVNLNGERGRNRTFNLLIKSQLLCQLSYAPAVED